MDKVAVVDKMDKVDKTNKLAVVDEMDETLYGLQGKLMDACETGEMDAIESILDNGINLNFHCEMTQMSPLQWACRQTEPWVIDVVTKLIEHGADVDLTDENDETALDCCLHAVPFQEHVAQLLLDCSKLGVNRMFPNNSNYLYFAHSVDAIKFLVKNGIDINNVHHYEDLSFTKLDDLHIYGKRDCIDYLVSIGGKRYSEL